MTSRSTYICFDTNIYVFCALATKDAMNPGLLKKLFADMDALGVRLLVPEVVKLELPKVMERERENLRAALNSIKGGISQNKVLGGDAKSELEKSLDKQKEQMRREIDKVSSTIEKRMANSRKSAAVELSAGDVVNEAIRIAVRGDRPSKASGDYGLLQSDCLIVASLKHFRDLNPDSHIVLCTDNTRDFAISDGGDGFLLHPDITSYLGDIDFCTRPTELYNGVLAGESPAEKEIEVLDSAFEAAQRRSINAANATRAQSLLEREAYINAVGRIAAASQAYARIDEIAKKRSASAVLALTKAAQSGIALGRDEDLQSGIDAAVRVLAMEGIESYADAAFRGSLRALYGEGGLEGRES